MATSAGLPGFNTPAVGFEQPFAMLEACHERVERTLTLLSRLRSYLREQAVDDAARQAARDVLRYFDIAAPLHHEDEELHVFPLLLARGAPSVVALVRQLQQDHVHMAADWAAARGALAALADGSAAGLSSGRSAARAVCPALRPAHPGRRRHRLPQRTGPFGRGRPAHHGAGDGGPSPRFVNNCY